MPPVRPAAGEKTFLTSIVIDSIELNCLVIYSYKRKKTISYTVRYDNIQQAADQISDFLKPTIFVRAPAKLDFKEIQSILIENKKHIFESLEKAGKKEKVIREESEKTYADGSIFHYLGRTYDLKLIFEDEINLSHKHSPAQLLDGQLRVFLPRKMIDLSEKIRAQKIKKAIEIFYIEQADVFFNSRVDYFAEKYSSFLGGKPKSVKAVYYKSKWGCCTYQNDLKFNWVLIQAEIPIIDYVIVHELCHIRHKNHSKEFWNLVELIDPKYKEKRRELKENGWILGLR